MLLLHNLRPKRDVERVGKQQGKVDAQIPQIKKGGMNPEETFL